MRVPRCVLTARRRLAAVRELATSESRGFTLVELLVVVVIIGVLAGIAVPVFLNQRAKAEETARASDLTAALRYLSQGAATGGTPVSTSRVALPSTNGVSNWSVPGFFYSTDASGMSFCVDNGTDKMRSALMGTVASGVCTANGT